MAAGPIGRGRALAAVDAFVADSSTGSAALLIEGAAGIGKTAVWRAAVESATAKGCIVLQAAAEQAEARMSLVGLVDLLDGCYDAIAGDLPAPQRGALDRALLRAVPERPVAGRRPRDRDGCAARSSR
jgi:predicted ATPase